MDAKTIKPTFQAAEHTRLSSGLQPRRRPENRKSVGGRNSTSLHSQGKAPGPSLTALRSPLSLDEVMSRNRALLDEIIQIHGSHAGAEAVSPKAVEEEGVDVLCLNCYSCVAVDDVDSHSKGCYEQKTTHQDEFVIRAQKLYQSLWNSKQTAVPTRHALFQELLDIAKALLTDAEDFTQLERALQSLISRSSIADLALCIFARRLLYLTEEYPQRTATVDSQGLTSEQLLSHYEQELEKQRAELEKWRRKSELLVKAVQHRDLNEVTSEVGSDFERGSVHSGCSEMSSLSGFDDLELPEPSSEEKQKMFYSICLKIKMGLPKEHPCQQVLISALYERCQRDAVPMNLWDNFIRANMKVVVI
jgi:hypothetical protein